MFNQLYRQGEQVKTESDDDTVWVCAAKGEEQCAMVTYYNDDDANAPAEKTVKLAFSGVTNPEKVKVECYLLDADHDCDIIREEVFTSTEFAVYLKLPLYGSYLVKIVTD